MADSLIEAIELRQYTFRKKRIIYLDTFLGFGKYSNLQVKYIINYDLSYAKWLFGTIDCYVSDEVSELMALKTLQQHKI